MLPDKHNRAVGAWIAQMSNERDRGELVSRSNKEGGGYGKLIKNEGALRRPTGRAV